MAMWQFTAAVLEGRPVRVFNHGEMSRDFTFIDDAVAGVLAALDRPPPRSLAGTAGEAPHRIYNIGNSRPERLLDALAAVERAAGRRARRIMEPMQPGDVPATWADISAARRDLGYAPDTPLSVGVPRFVAWFRAYHGC
jgi:UDP-glucuronate 4-epimerase